MPHFGALLFSRLTFCFTELLSSQLVVLFGVPCCFRPEAKEMLLMLAIERFQVKDEFAFMLVVWI